MFDNPISSLAKKAWNFSAGNRPRVVLFVIFFIIANIISLLEPLIVAKILNTVQEHGISQENFHTYLFLISLFIIQTVAFWIFHGPARVIETTNAFLVRANYKQYLLRGTLSLPLEIWDHAIHLRLLKHDLRDKDRIRVACLAPRQMVASALFPVPYHLGAKSFQVPCTDA
jgi:ABC-type multidrug transport system fused ATPase/permease subunit